MEFRGYRYGFNGKENDNEVKGEGNQQDYGMRIYDPRIGKFLSVDPLTKSYPELTPYQFGSNRPIDGIDQDGLEYSPAGKNTGGVPRDATAVRSYDNHPGILDTQVKDAPLREKLNLIKRYSLDSQSNASVGTTANLGYYGNKLHKERSAELFKAAGWNADGSEPAWHKLVNNKTFKNFSENIGLPMTNWVLADGIGKLAFEGVAYSRLTGLTSSEWMGGAGKFTSGSDIATLKSSANLIPKRGWYDVVIHGDSYYVGYAFNNGSGSMTAEQLHSLMLQNGYQNGTKIRLISCDAATGPLAQNLSNISEAALIAPAARTKVVEGGKLITEDGSKYLFIKPEK